MSDITQSRSPALVGSPVEAVGSEYRGHDLDAMSVADRYSREIVRAFAPYLGRKVVEVGAGTGNISVILLEQRLARLDAIEPDTGMWARLTERVGHRVDVGVHKGFLAGELARDRLGKVDSVVSVNVLEHVEDDAKELALMHSVLRPGGHLCLWVPALPALYSGLDRTLGHFRRYRRSELARKLTAAGFETLVLHYRDLVGMVAWFVSCRMLGQELTKGKVELYDRLVLPVTSVIGRWIQPPIGKNLVAIARKPRPCDMSVGPPSGPG